MKFTKWIQSRREDGPAKAMVATVRVEFDLTPEDVAYQLLYAAEHEGGPEEGSDPEDVAEWIAGLSQAEAFRLVKWAIVDMGASDYLFMYVSERQTSDAIAAAVQAVVDRFVDDDTITRLFGKDAA